MSLLDTIKAAREEAEQAGTLLTSKDKAEAEKEKAPEQEASTSTSTGFSRRSTARAKPMREAAGSVHRGSKPTSEMTKEEKKAAKEQKRNDEDLLLDAKRAVLESREDYKHTQRVWWAMVIAGVAASIIAYLTMRYMQSNGVESYVLASMSVAMMAIAYLLIIGAFIYDLRKVRPLRQQADNKILGMSKRKLRKVVEEDEARKQAKKEKKA